MALRRKQLTAENAQIRLENMCARSEHCEYELRDKLRTWGVGTQDAEKILETLHKARYYDDSRFAEAFVRDKLLYNHWGRRKIIIGLKAKRIDGQIIEEALATIEEDVYKRILKGLMKAKARSLKEGNTFEGRTKLYRFALARGFESALIGSLLKSGVLFEEQED